MAGLGYGKWDSLDLSDEEEETPPFAHLEMRPGEAEPPHLTSTMEDLLGLDCGPWSDASSSSSDGDAEGEAHALREEFGRYDPIVTHAVEDDVHALHARLREAPDWQACLAYDECEGLPPLHFAALSGSVRAARLLLEAGASARRKDRTGHTALAHVLRAAVTRSADRERLGSLLSARAEEEEEARAAQQAVAELDASLEQLRHLASDLVASGAAPSDVRAAPSSGELIEWAERHARWADLLAAAAAEDEGEPECGAEVAQLVRQAPHVAAQLTAEALERAAPRPDERWRLLRPSAGEARADRPWWGALCEAAWGALTHAGREELRSACAPPAGSRLLFWEIVCQLGATALASVLLAHPSLNERALLSCAARQPKLAAAARLEAELASLHAAVRNAARGDAAAHSSLAAQLPPRVPRCRQLNLVGRDGCFPLQIAAAEGAAEVVELLLAGRANPNICGGGAVGTALQAAVACGAAGVARRLLASRAEPNRVGRDARAPAAPLLLAVRRGDGALVQMLLEAHAEPHAKDGEGRDAFDAAAGRQDLLRLLRPDGTCGECAAPEGGDGGDDARVEAVAVESREASQAHDGEVAADGAREQGGQEQEAREESAIDQRAQMQEVSRADEQVPLEELRLSPRQESPTQEKTVNPDVEGDEIQLLEAKIQTLFQSLLEVS
ncbi:hypothetical protein AB1Y20_008676 [Prymnesium parvum]|uniref:Nuclear factor of kappa light polypeptide gene enhancer in B-cells inhibitor-like 1 n=1 Tax=Prymnesium parvum TaxID=97485 RepID=A0AB34ITS5_PRYPA